MAAEQAVLSYQGRYLRDDVVRALGMGIARGHVPHRDPNGNVGVRMGLVLAWRDQCVRVDREFTDGDACGPPMEVADGNRVVAIKHRSWPVNRGRAKVDIS